MAIRRTPAKTIWWISLRLHALTLANILHDTWNAGKKLTPDEKSDIQARFLLAYYGINRSFPQEP